MTVTATTLAIGTSLGPYKILRKIGEGGMGEVYDALDERLHRHAVIKIISANANGEMREKALQNFLREARALGCINHVNVVTVYAIDKIENIDFIAMERVHGPDLRAVLKNYIFTAEEATPLLLQMLEGLEALHSSGILHRDLKPANLILRPNGQIKLLDFGVAKFLGDEQTEKTATVIFEGTLLYTAPELAAGKVASELSDLWSIGAIFFECMVGRRVVQSPDPDNFLLTLEYIKQVEAKVPPECEPWIPAPVRAILHKLCARAPSERYPTAAAAIVDVKAFLATRPTPKVSFYRTVTRPPRNVEQAKARIETRGFSTSQMKRILTLAAIRENEAHPMAELSMSDSLGNLAPDGIEISEPSVDVSIVRFTNSQLVKKSEAPTAMHPRPSAKLQRQALAQIFLAGVLVLCLGLIGWEYFHPASLPLTQSKVLPAPSANYRPASPPPRQPAHDAVADSGSLVSTPYHGYSIEMSSALPADLAAKVLAGIQKQLDIVDNMSLRPKFAEYIHGIRILVRPGQKDDAHLDDSDTLIVADRPLDGKDPLFLGQYLRLFAQTAPPEILDHADLTRLYAQAKQNRYFPRKMAASANEGDYFALIATAFLYDSATDSTLSKVDLQQVQPDSLNFLRKVFRARVTRLPHSDRKW